MNLLLLHIAACFFMTGVIWFVQIVHYPLFAFQSEGTFHRFESEHVRRTTYIVMPAMIIELITASLLVYGTELGTYAGQVYVLNLTLLGAIFLITFFVQVPQHNRLQQGFSADLIKQLVFWNWPRTILWSVRSILLVSLL